MKEKILTLLKEMTNDSKSASYKAERELCSILTEVINKLHTVEKKVGSYIRYYPEKIESIDDEYYLYDELPTEIYCNDEDFCFETEWLDINLREYFEKLKKREIGCIKNRIFHAKSTLCEHERDLQHIEKLKFEDLGI